MAKRKHINLLPGIVAAIFAGFLVGGFFPAAGIKFSILGKIFLNLLTMIVMPLVIFSLIVGITNLGEVGKIGGIGRRTLAYYISTTAISVLIGLVMVNLIKPGRSVMPGEEHARVRYVLEGDDYTDVRLIDGRLRRADYNGRYDVILSDQKVRGRIIAASGDRIAVRSWESLDNRGRYYITGDDGEKVPLRESGGYLAPDSVSLNRNGAGISIKLPPAEGLALKKDRGIIGTIEVMLTGDASAGREGMIPRNVFSALQNMEVLPVIFFSILLGLALSAIGEAGKPAIDVACSLNAAVLRLVDWIMLLSPPGIFGIIAHRVGAAGGFSGFLPELAAIGLYAATVITGLLVHALVVLPFLLSVIGRRRPLVFVSGVGVALLNAFSTASSSATLPLSMKTVENNNGISQRTAGFVLPLGATINMDGTALYEAVAALFIAQVYGIDLSAADQAIVFITATLAAVGAAGIPEAGLVTMVLVLRAVGLPVEGIGLILAIDWFLDRCRTTVNVWGDIVGTGIIETLESRAINNGHSMEVRDGSEEVCSE
ncbi:MAG TPA: dicarboxylate/amino acid:cation symporter [Spirochaetota bacterium]|nr:dicarboxylate/amino acid:cation symporter [Spirochaetota bacterium]HPI89960.1 dicarboxylate/amino acid:cation symporter [Spirochaetota bacterium]HPR48441.1 dicarboxylate/amino acid:cation symporter [Spirochaetota bacterium]